ncbi:hypothetical protein [Acinetobacter sp. MD2(2019)]|uniref:hypothetical protein n=1 Tax=Acinetobacter sp. MD2(2019) TaxID=2605273 RepID=UPI002D1F0133|nr:hypothetical protein [Acinetobacter sp. MD2(2019)]MEB3754260.1 hypothetical protein [Acinetobacter sp. MD2(2019)]
MKKLNTLALATATLIGLGALTGCQSGPIHPKPPKPNLHSQPAPPLSAQQQEQRRANLEKIKQACVGKNAGDTTQVTIQDQRIAGTCEIHFHPLPPAGKPVLAGNAAMPAAPQDGQLPPPPPQNATDATANNPQPMPMPPKHRPMKKHHEKIFKNACNGQPIGQEIKVSVKNQSVVGMCELHFHPDRPFMPSHQLPPQAAANAPAAP